ncbi:SUMO-specific isopeptidase USPL1 [Centropristis striata]|uniref:SUMO-specific isopeptidase USPL1 n=1 Tax=Centropristis striata TaxID=184440 RepID=UPI0027E1DD16|nr:SUMO-specific isopeptidase USPL1 [Centropristis striata]
MLHSCKVQERAASLEFCPWCAAKGSSCALRSYRINLQESITLCTNTQCLFPLVSRSLDDVLAGLVPAKPSVLAGLVPAEPSVLAGLVPAEPSVLAGLVPAEPSVLAGLVPAEPSVLAGLVPVEPSVLAGLVPVEPSVLAGLVPVEPSVLAGLVPVEPSVLAGLVPAEPSVGNKRRNVPTLEDEESIKPAHKRQRSSEVQPQNVRDASEARAEHAAVGVNCQHAATHHGTLDGNRESPGREARRVEDKVLQEEPENAASEEEEGLNRLCSLDNQALMTNEDIHSSEINTPSRPLSEQTARTEEESPAGGIKSQIEDLSSDSEELVPVPDRLFWSNRDNLCWLDSLLVALVNCRSLRRRRPEEEPRRSSVWTLIRRYEDISAAVQDHQQTGEDGVVRAPHHVLQKADADLQSLRMSTFTLLQHKLHCKLGQKETPVFALPLLLQSDSWAEPLLQTSFSWEFSCTSCRSSSTERVMKTLPTFTNVLPGWRPLDAVHAAPCNVCRQKNQRRAMKLESVPPVFALHFVDGLPDSNVRKFSFSFRGKQHNVSAVIQYRQHLKHFVTWTRNPDGSWLEFDDLKHPACRSHQRLPVPAQEMHVVFWEADEDQESRACSPSSTFSESPLSKNEVKPLEELKTVDELPDQSRLDDTADIVSALTDGADAVDAMDVTLTADTSIGSTTLLDAFEGLSHNDIITLTLVELNPETLNEDKQTEESSVPGRKETPDSSSAVELTATASSSADSPDDSSSDPSFVPAGRRERRKGRGAARNRRTARRRAAGAAPAVVEASPEPSEPAKVIKPAAAALDDAAPVRTTAAPVRTTAASPESSSDASTLATRSTGQPRPALPPQSARWSFLLSKHPLNQFNKSVTKVAANQSSMAPLKPAAPATADPVRRPLAAGGPFPKPALRTEESEGLPLKAAEMYRGFSGKTLKTASQLPPAALNKTPNGTSNQQKSVSKTPSAARPPEISSSQKHGALPVGLSDADVLRYKLIKKLKAKKKKLARLNQMLGPDGAGRPDSTALGSPGAVTSSTADGADQLLSDLLSPATTASNLSPDSTEFLEMLAGPDGAEQLEVKRADASNDDDFLDEFLSQAETQIPTDMETEALSALELFI